MSRSLNGGTSDGQSVLSAPATVEPLSMHCWVKPSDNSFVYCAYITDAGGSNAWNIGYDDTAGGLHGAVSKAFAAVSGGGAEVAANTTTTIDRTKWNSILGVFTSNTSRAVYLNGGGVGTDSTSRNPVGVDRLSTVGVFNGACLLAHVAVWNVALTADEALMLASGLSPAKVRPASLVFWTPYMGRDTLEIDVLGRRDMTVTGGAASSDNPPVAQPGPRFRLFPQLSFSPMPWPRTVFV